MTEHTIIVGETINRPAGAHPGVQIPTRDAVTGEVIPPAVHVDQLGDLADGTDLPAG